MTQIKAGVMLSIICLIFTKNQARYAYKNMQQQTNLGHLPKKVLPLILTSAVSLLPKCNALQCLWRQIDRMQCLNATFYALFSERHQDRVVETLEKKQWNAAEFFGSILHHANSFSKL